MHGRVLPVVRAVRRVRARDVVLRDIPVRAGRRVPRVRVELRRREVRGGAGA